MSTTLAATTPIIDLPPLFDALAITAGATSGALHAIRKEFDLVGVLGIAFITALGGGLIRDVILEQGTPAFLTNPPYLMYAVAGAVVGVAFARLVARWQFALTVVDFSVLGVWVVLGCQKAAAAGLPPMSVVFVGIVAAVGGGLLRDLSCGDVPTALRPGEWLAAAALLAGCTYVSLMSIGAPLIVAELATIAVALGLRWAVNDTRLHPPRPIDVTERLRSLLVAKTG